jgi:hypothetical protein
MANTLKTQSRNVALWHERPVIVLQDFDGHNYRGVVIGPEGMTIPQALTLLDQIFAKTVEDHPDDWNYDEVIQYEKGRF